MKWILFTGTWRLTNPQVEADVRLAVREVIGRGEGVLTGGATGVDYFAMDEAMKLKPDGSHLKNNYSRIPRRLYNRLPYKLVQKTNHDTRHRYSGFIS